MAATVTPIRNLRHVARDTGYRFVEQDSKMVELCAIITDSGKEVAAITDDVHKKSRGVCSISRTTINNWLNGTTRRPQNFTMDWVGFALGYERKWTKI